MRKLVEPFIVGLLLAPVGSIAGSIVLAALDASPDMLFLIVAGAVFGAVYALPVAACVLPTAYVLLRRYSQVRTSTLVIVGMAAGGLLMLGDSIFSALIRYNDPLFYFRLHGTVISSLIIAGSLAGALMAAIFSWLMRVRDPVAWFEATERAA